MKRNCWGQIVTRCMLQLGMRMETVALNWSVDWCCCRRNCCCSCSFRSSWWWLRWCPFNCWWHCCPPQLLVIVVVLLFFHWIFFTYHQYPWLLLYCARNLCSFNLSPTIFRELSWKSLFASLFTISQKWNYQWIWMSESVFSFLQHAYSTICWIQKHILIWEQSSLFSYL